MEFVAAEATDAEVYFRPMLYTLRLQVILKWSKSTLHGGFILTETSSSLCRSRTYPSNASKNSFNDILKVSGWELFLKSITNMKSAAKERRETFRNKFKSRYISTFQRWLQSARVVQKQQLADKRWTHMCSYPCRKQPLISHRTQHTQVVWELRQHMACLLPWLSSFCLTVSRMERSEKRWVEVRWVSSFCIKGALEGPTSTVYLWCAQNFRCFENAFGAT